jgi:hypothetical protein
MPKFRKKPVVIEAEQWLGANHLDIADFIGVGDNYTFEKGEMIIHTLEGDMRASLNDWIIKGVKGEFYPCKPDIFEATYEAV